MNRTRKILLSLALLFAAGAVLLSEQSLTQTTASGGASQFDRDTVQRGAQLAAVGNCMSCHTVPDNLPYAGGAPLATPFGLVHGTNITPDPDTGIGSWSLDDFKRAMREGVAPKGRRLYPVFPYDHFRRASDEDLSAVYAYLMTRTPVRSQAPANRLRFPYNMRGLLVIWNWMFLDKTPFRADTAQSAEWNRGAYLAQTFGHCSACHSPRNRFGAIKKDAYLDGGQAQGWYSPPLNRNSPSPLPWTVEELTVYLRTGMAGNHAIAGGPMQDVVHNLAQADERDVRAIAVYIRSVMGETAADRGTLANGAKERVERGMRTETAANDAANEDLKLGASIYADACAECHDRGRQLSSNSALQLPYAVALYDADPSSLLRIILDGITPLEGESGRFMPGYRGVFTDEQLNALLMYLRAGGAGQPAWRDLPKKIEQAQNR